MIYSLARSAAQKLSFYLKDRMTEEWLRRFSFILDEDITWEDLNHKDPPEESFPGHPVLKLTENNPLGRTCVELAVFSRICPFAGEIFEGVIPGNGSGISLKLAWMVQEGKADMDVAQIADAYSLIEKILLLKEEPGDLMEQQYEADFTLMSFLQNQYMPSPEMEGMVAFWPAKQETEEMILWEEESERLASKIREAPSSLSVIYGEAFSGRGFFAAHTARKCGLGILMADFRYFSHRKHNGRLRQSIQHVVRDCFLLGSGLCIREAAVQEGMGKEDMVQILRSVSDGLSFAGLPIFVTAKPETSVIPFLEQTIFSFTIPKLNASQSLKVWNYFGRRQGKDFEECCHQVAGRIILPVGKIKQAAARFALEENQKDIFRLSELCYEQMDSDQYSGVKRIYPAYTWEDLKLPPMEKDMLRQICNHVMYRDKIMEQWDMGKFYAYGNCVSALFKGAPGTGKTMAAHVIANELHMALYQVDLSRVLDKYIGETEKRLEEIFAMAEKGNVILFLDEADALLGKRSEIHSSHDRYSNNEMAYILQRMEAFDGILLMATNLSSNLEPAMIRRIRYVVNFTMPDRNRRKQIWQSLFHEKLPHDTIDFDFLSSDDFAFSGASIKNIMMNAMVRAGAEKIPLNMDHLMYGIKEEYRKMEITAFFEQWTSCEE